jgi:hypothetical protein
MRNDNESVNVPLWTTLTTVGLAAGLVAGLLVGKPLGEIANAMVVTAAVTCCVGGVLGTAQAFGLRSRLRAPFWWILATMAGVGIGLAVGVVMVEQVGIVLTGSRPNIARLSSVARAFSLFVVGLTSGAFLGAAQMLVLRSQASGVKHWLPVTAAALATAFSASSLIVDLFQLRFASLPGVITFVLLAGIVFGAVTSWPLRRAA